MGRWLRAAAAMIALTAVASGCISEAAGTVVWGVNESDRDVIVASQHHGRSLRLPARSWGKLFDDYAPPSDSVRVFDEGCQPLADLALTSAQSTVHITPDGVTELLEDSPGVVPETVDRSPAGANGVDAFEAVDCSQGDGP